MIKKTCQFLTGCFLVKQTESEIEHEKTLLIGKKIKRMNNETVILVDEKDHELGVMEKMEAHQKGLLHRAVSVLVFNEQHEVLLQQRAAHKYHSALLWSNTCCTHPKPGETPRNAAERRLQEEMGISIGLEKKFDFIYRAELDHELVEHEFDHVFFGLSNEVPKLNSAEACAYRWMSVTQLKKDMEANPKIYTQWFKILVERLV